MELSKVMKLTAFAGAAFALLAMCWALCLTPAQAYAQEGDGLTAGQGDFAALGTQGKNDSIVFIAESSDQKIYHFDSECSGMKDSSSMELGDALAQGYKACEKCAAGKSYIGAERLWGDTALDTMNDIVNQGSFASGHIVLTTVDGYWDALSAAGLAGAVDAPILMTDGKKLSVQAENQIKKLKPTTIYVCGGPDAVSAEVLLAAKAAADTADPTGDCFVMRFSGDDAVGTANDIAVEAYDMGITPWLNVAFVCTNGGYWDALAAAPFAYARDIPIFLTDGSDNITDETLAAMKKIGVTDVFIVGGEEAISKDVEQQITDANIGITSISRYGGEDAIETSELVAALGVDTFGMTPNKMGVATISGYWDALAGAALCGENESVLVLVDDVNSSSISGFIKGRAKDIDLAYIFGGEAVISAETAKAIVAAICG